MPTADGQLTAAEVAELYALVRAQAAVRRQITQAVTAAAIAPWWAFRGWYSSAEIGATVAGILRIVQPLQRRMAQVTDVYMARQLTLVSGRRFDPIGAIDVTRLRRALPEVEYRPDERDTDFTFTDDQRGTGATFTDDQRSRDVSFTDVEPDVERGWMNPMVVYGRPADTYRYLVTEKDASPEEAVVQAVRRAEQIAETDVALAMREQSRQVLVRSNATGYRRVLHPELSQDGVSCGLCIVAADRVYQVKDLLPLHPQCHCEVSPILNGVDPGRRLNEDDLARLYQAAGGTTGGRKLQNRVRAAITEHGELGPVLVRSNHKFRSPADVAATKASQTREGRRRRSDETRAQRTQPRGTTTDPAVFRRRRIEALEESLAAMERLQARGDDWSRQLVDTRSEIARLRESVAL